MTLTAFGLDVSADVPLLFDVGHRCEPTGRTLAIDVRRGKEAELNWPGASELVCDERTPDDEVIFCIHSHPDAGYLISGPDYGDFVLSADGRHVICAPGEHPDQVWQRLLISQVMPFASLLQGLEVFHASAVVLEGRAIAFLGPSHVGKSSLALELCRRGATFLADDVLAVEAAGTGLLSHPGTRLASIAHAEAQRYMSESFPGEVIAVNDRERLVKMPGDVGPVALGTLFFLSRGGESHELSFEPAADPQMLLTAPFNFLLTTPSRLHNLLDVCSRAAQGRVERITYGAEIDATRLAAEIEHRVAASV